MSLREDLLKIKMQSVIALLKSLKVQHVESLMEFTHCSDYPSAVAVFSAGRYSLGH